MNEIVSLIQPGACLCDFTTFQLGGPCKGLICCESPAQVESALAYFRARKEPFLLMGRGSNLLFSDQGIDAYVVRFLSDKVCVEHDGTDIEVSAGTVLDDLISYTVAQGWAGLVSLSGIPGTVGGAVAGNAGAFGEQMSQSLHSVKIITPQGFKKQVPAQELDFGYRDSLLKRTSDVILSVRLSLSRDDKARLDQERKAILRLRREKHPPYQTIPSAGSFFRNLEPIKEKGKRQSAGLLLEQINAKQMHYGGARVYEKHANIIVKDKDCTARDVYVLSGMMAEKVRQRFDVDLVREVRFVGSFVDSRPRGSALLW